MRNLFQSIQRQSIVIYALMLREVSSRHGNDSAGTLWVLLEPIVITLIVVGIHIASGADIIKSVPVVVFLLTGYVPHMLFRHVGLAGVNGLNANGGLLYHHQVHYVDIVLARYGVESTTVLISFFLVSLGFIVFGQIGLPRFLPYIYLGWFLHLWFALSACFIFTGVCIRFPLVKRMFMPLCLVMIPIYAAFFMLAWVPPAERNFLLWFPPADASEVMRYGYFGPSVPTYFNIGYTIECCTALTVVSILIMNWGRRYLEV